MSGFAVPACAACGHAVWPPRLACGRCGAAEWGEAGAATGTVLEVTDAPGAAGVPIRLGTILLTAGDDEIPVIARCEGCEPGDRVDLELVDGALRARPQSVSK